MTNLINSNLWQRFDTWQIEMTFAVFLFFGTAIVCPGSPFLLYGTAFALAMTFGYVQISTRLQEAQESLRITHVECLQKLNVYLAIKEVVWVILFIYMGGLIPLSLVLYCFYCILHGEYTIGTEGAQINL